MEWGKNGREGEGENESLSIPLSIKILSQIIMASPGTLLVKNHESRFRIIGSQLI